MGTTLARCLSVSCEKTYLLGFRRNVSMALFTLSTEDLVIYNKMGKRFQFSICRSAFHAGMTAIMTPTQVLLVSFIKGSLMERNLFPAVMPIQRNVLKCEKATVMMVLVQSFCSLTLFGCLQYQPGGHGKNNVNNKSIKGKTSMRDGVNVHR